eukprot:2526052-Pyramimonas_sp.AAC.1
MKLAKAKAAGKKGAKGKASASKGSSLQPLAMDTGIVEHIEEKAAEMTILSHIETTKQYLVAKDPRQRDIAEAFRLASFKGLFQGNNSGIEIRVKGVTKNVKGFSQLRMAVKSEVYRMARLVPRASDPDCEALLRPTEVEAEASVVAAPKRYSKAEVEEIVEDSQDDIDNFISTMLVNSPNVPVTGHVCAAKALNGSMVSVMTKLAEISPLMNSKVAYDRLIEETSEHVLEVYPMKWDAHARMIDCLSSTGDANLLTDLIPRTKDLFDMKVTARLLHLLRQQLHLHLVSSLSSQMALVQVGTSAVPTPYVPKMIHDVVAQRLMELSILRPPRTEAGDIAPRMDAITCELWDGIVQHRDG